MPTRRILLAVTGLSPQIVTETLYALCTATPAWIPDEIHLITSRDGADRAKAALLHPEHGHFHAFCRDHDATAIDFGAHHIHCIHDEDGHPLPDIRSPEHNACAANCIYQLIRQLTADPTTELHVSIAGGRKTMGFYLGYCLSLTARANDRLSHVLVSEPFESLPDFYYPPPTPRLIQTRQGHTIDTRDARIMLADIPFVRLRQLLPAETLAAPLSFGEIVAATQSHLEPPRLQLHLGPANSQLSCGQHTIQLPPQLLAWYAWFAHRQQQGLPPLHHTSANPRPFLAIYGQLIGTKAHAWEKTSHDLATGINKEFFEQKRSKLNRALQKQLGHAATPYLITCHHRRPRSLYGLTLPPESISIDGLPPTGTPPAPDLQTTESVANRNPCD